MNIIQQPEQQEKVFEKLSYDHVKSETKRVKKSSAKCEKIESTNEKWL